MRRQDERRRGISDTNFWPDTFEGDSLEARHAFAAQERVTHALIFD
jgi:hypothetical protein